MASSKPKKRPLLIICLIAVLVVVVLAVASALLFYTGAFNSHSITPQGCIALSGYYCQNTTFHNGVLSFKFGQATGVDWTSATLYFVPSGQAYDPTTQTYSSVDGLNNQILNVSIAIPSGVASSAAGTLLHGTLYANYTMSVGRNITRALVQVAFVSAEAT